MPLRSVLGHFPPMRFAFAYGSGVFAQRGNVPSMIDLVFAVDAPEEWHAENLKTNSHHYSFMKHLGPGAIAQVPSALLAPRLHMWCVLWPVCDCMCDVLCVCGCLSDCLVFFERRLASMTFI